MIHISHKQIESHLIEKMNEAFKYGFDYDKIELNIESFHELGITDEKLGLLYFDITLSGTYIFNCGFQYGCYDFEIKLFDSNDNEIKFKLDITNDELIDNLTNYFYECV